MVVGKNVLLIVASCCQILGFRCRILDYLLSHILLQYGFVFLLKMTK